MRAIRRILMMLMLAAVVVVASGGSCAGCPDTADEAKTAPTPEPTSLGVSATQVDLVVGGSQTVNAVVNGPPGVDQTVTWSSGAPSIATVDQAGKITGVAPGTTFVVVTTRATPSLVKTITVTVKEVDVAQMYGTFNITATKVTDTGCNFAPTFQGQLELTGNKDGTATTMRLIERLVRIYTGTTSQNGTFSGTGSGNLDGFGYSGTISGQVSGNAISGTETMNFTSGCPGRQVAYNLAGNRQ